MMYQRPDNEELDRNGNPISDYTGTDTGIDSATAEATITDTPENPGDTAPGAGG